MDSQLRATALALNSIGYLSIFLGPRFLGSAVGFAPRLGPDDFVETFHDLFEFVWGNSSDLLPEPLYC